MALTGRAWLCGVVLAALPAVAAAQAQPVQAQPVQAQPVQAQPVQAKPTPDKAALEKAALDRPAVREVGALVYDGVPEQSRAEVARAAQFLNVRSAALAGWTADRAMLVTTVFGDTAQVHRVAAPGSYRQQLTFFDEPVRGVWADPLDAKRLVVSLDAGGGEFYQFYRYDLDSGQKTLLTDGKSRNEGVLFSRKGDRFAHVSTRRNGKDFDLWLQSQSDPNSSRLVKELSGQWTPRAWSPDDRQLLLERYVSVHESHLHLLDLATGAMSELGARSGPHVAIRLASFLGPNTVVAASDDGAEFLRLVRYDLSKPGAPPELLAPQLAWDVAEIEVSPDGQWLAWTANEGGTSGLYLAPAARPRDARKVELPRGVAGHLEFDNTSQRLGLSFDAGNSPEDAWSLELATGKLTRWTFSEAGGLDPAGFRAPELVKFATFDGKQIPAWLYKPAGSKGKLPVVVSIHGGPEGQSMAHFSPMVQFWLRELGVAVLLPNVRGSSGYGKTYLGLDNAERREDSVRDIGALLDWVARQPDLDAARVAVIGGSYGGYMSLASLVHFGERLRCGVDVVGISHFVSFLERTEAYRRDLRRVEYGDERDPAMRALLDRISPLTNAARIAKPLFVVQGANDPRVPQQEAEQIVRRVRAEGRPVWYLLARDEGHGFSRKKNREAYLAATAAFFRQHLLADKP
jgi:dipeptidyl aminopeptidase/acylaminoacyl peptidase